MNKKMSEKIISVLIFGVVILFITLLLNFGNDKDNGKIYDEIETTDNKIKEGVISSGEHKKSLKDMTAKECYDSLVEYGLDMGIFEGKYDDVKIYVDAFIDDPSRFGNANFSHTELFLMDLRETVFEYEGIEDPVSEEEVKSYIKGIQEMCTLPSEEELEQRRKKENN